MTINAVNAISSPIAAQTPADVNTSEEAVNFGALLGEQIASNITPMIESDANIGDLPSIQSLILESSNEITSDLEALLQSIQSESQNGEELIERLKELIDNLFTAEKNTGTEDYRAAMLYLADMLASMVTQAQPIENTISIAPAPIIAPAEAKISSASQSFSEVKAEISGASAEGGGFSDLMQNLTSNNDGLNSEEYVTASVVNEDNVLNIQQAEPAKETVTTSAAETVDFETAVKTEQQNTEPQINTQPYETIKNEVQNEIEIDYDYTAEILPLGNRLISDEIYIEANPYLEPEQEIISETSSTTEPVITTATSAPISDNINSVNDMQTVKSDLPVTEIFEGLVTIAKERLELVPPESITITDKASETDFMTQDIAMYQTFLKNAVNFKAMPEEMNSILNSVNPVINETAEIKANTEMLAPEEMSAIDEAPVSTVQVKSENNNSNTNTGDNNNNQFPVNTNPFNPFSVPFEARLAEMQHLYESAPVPVPTQISEQIIAHISTLQDGTTEFNMQLNPEGLGRITVKLLTEGKGAELQITAERPETAELLRSRMDNMNIALKQNDIDLQKYIVYEEAQSYLNQEGRGEQQRQQQNRDTLINNETEANETDISFADLIQEMSS